MATQSKPRRKWPLVAAASLAVVVVAGCWKLGLLFAPAVPKGLDKRLAPPIVQSIQVRTVPVAGRLPS